MSQFPKVQFIKSVALPGQFPADEGWEVAVAGRSNAGKSSAINKVVARKGLARTSRTPGRTQLYNYFELEPGLRMLDMPGYGHASVRAATRESWGPLGDELLTRQSFAALFVIVDSRRGVGEMDLGLLAWASRPADFTHVLLSKCDKLSRAEAQQTLRNANELLKEKASCQLFSAHDGQGVDEARAVLLRWMRSAKK